MSKKLIGTLIALVAIFSLLILLIAINFGGVKERYKQIEPNLDNYSVAEILFLAFERTKTALLLSENDDYDAFLIKRKYFTRRSKSWRAAPPSATLSITTTNLSRTSLC